MSHIEWTSGFPPLVENKPYLVYIDSVQRPGIGRAIMNAIGNGWRICLHGDHGILGKSALFEHATIQAWAELNNPVLGDNSK